MYADVMTDSMKSAIDETNRRRDKQIKFNEEHGIEPVSIVKAVRDLTDQMTAQAVAEQKAEYRATAPLDMPRDELARLIRELEKQMHSSAESLEFEKAAAIRDQIFELRQTLAEMDNLPPWQRVRMMAGETDPEL